MIDDGLPPAILGVDTVVDTGDGVLAACEVTAAGISRILLTFSEAMDYRPGDVEPDDVTDPDSYRLLATGPDRDLATAACGPVLGDDLAITVDRVSYDPESHTATLELAAGVLGDAFYRLIACGATLRDLVGRTLDGDGDGLDGGDFLLDFRVDRENLLANGRFDCSLTGWTAESQLPGEVEYSSEDVDDAQVSGSARFASLGSDTTYALGQCLPVAGGRRLDLSARLRVETGPEMTLRVMASCDFDAQAQCAGHVLSQDQVVASIGATGGGWEPLSSTVAPPAGAVSALCSVVVTLPPTSGFQLFLDDAVLSGAHVFADGIESGDTSAW